jgi:hypothetical protein
MLFISIGDTNGEERVKQGNYKKIWKKKLLFSQPHKIVNELRNLLNEL